MNNLLGAIDIILHVTFFAVCNTVFLKTLQELITSKCSHIASQKVRAL